MTLLTKPVTRQSACLDRGVPLIVTLTPRYLELRVKGSRKKYTIAYDACLWLAMKLEAEGRMRGKGRERA